jgi:hypothetical protein
MKRQELVRRILTIALVALMIGAALGLGNIIAPIANHTTVVEASEVEVKVVEEKVVEASAVEAATLADGKGMWIWYIWELGSVSSIISELQSAGVSWVTIKCGDSNSYYPDHGSMLSWLTTNGYSGFGEVVTEFHNAGIKVFGWQYVYSYARWTGTGYSTEAAVSNEILDIPGIDGFIIDAEAEYEGTDKGPIAESYMLAIRSQHPSSFIAYAPFPIIDYHTWFPYLEFGKYCDAVMPQAYWQDIGVTPTEMVDWMNEQWDKWHAIWQSGGHGDSVKPLIPIGQGNTPGSEVTEFCGAVLSRYGGVSLWRYGIMTSGAWTAYAACGGNLPDLTPYEPSSWSDEIVVSKVTGTNTDDTPLTEDDTLYVDWAVLNQGTADVSGTVYYYLYVDGAHTKSWYSTDIPSAGYYVRVEDYSIGKLSAGSHTVKIVADATDAITESDEGNNEYSKTINISSSNTAPTLSSGYVNPTSGTTSTNFYYYVSYYDADGDSPSTKYVYIDGTAYTMSLYSGSAYNGVYRYGPKTLAAVSHNYYFYFTDGQGGTARLPASGTYSGPTVGEPNTPPQLSSGYVDPTSGTTSTNFYYYVSYYDADGDSPSTKYVYIDGTSYTMSLYSGSAYNGVYRYGPKTLAAVSHDYYFHFTDGQGGTARLPVSGTSSGPTVESPNTPPELSSGYVDPTSGTTSTNFYYYVSYYDVDGDSPGTKYVYIDGTAYTMSLYSGSAYNGVYRYGPKTLDAVSHDYYFYFTDGQGGTDRLPASGTYSGPSVTALEGVNLSIQPSTETVGVGEVFELVIQADAGVQPVSGIDAFVDFVPAHLEVVDADVGAPGIQITPGSALPTVIVNEADNYLGTIDFSAGKLGAPFPTGTFDVATIQFRALAPTSPSTAVTFSTSPPRQTRADYAGGDVTGTLTGGTVTVTVDAPVFLDPASSQKYIGQVFTLEIRTNVDSEQEVSGVQAFIDFDPDYLEVQSVTPGASLPTVLQNTYDNTAGTIDYSAGKLGAPFPTGEFVVATIEFKALAETTDTAVTFSFTGARTTTVDLGGSPIPGIHADATVEITSGVLVDISVVLQGGSRPPESWEVPITIKFFSPGADVMTDTPIYEFDLTTTKSDGTATCQCAGVAPGTYDITAQASNCPGCTEGNRTLMNVKRSVVISAPSTAVDMGTLLAGDANCDGIINISDFGILAVSYMCSVGEIRYDCRADFDCNGIINISDFGLLAVNYMKMSPIDIS